MTPIQKVLSIIEQELAEVKKLKSGGAGTIAALYQEIKPLLPYEKEWAEKVWKQGKARQEQEEICSYLDEYPTAPDFNTFYSQYNQDQDGK